jgi:hypothetical protein
MRTRAPPLAPHNPFPCPDLRSVRDACRKPIAHSCEGREVDVRLKGGARQDVQAPRTIQHQQVLPQGVRAGEGGGASQGHRHTDHRQRTTHGLSLFFAGFLFFSLSPTLGPKVQALPGRLGKSRLWPSRWLHRAYRTCHRDPNRAHAHINHMRALVRPHRMRVVVNERVKGRREG